MVMEPKGYLSRIFGPLRLQYISLKCGRAPGMEALILIGLKGQAGIRTS